MDEIMNLMHPSQTVPAEAHNTLNDKLITAEQHIVELKMKIDKLTANSTLNAKASLSQEDYRRQRLALLHSQMYGEEGHLYGGYGELRADKDGQQLPGVGPEEFLNVGEFLLDEGERPLVQEEFFMEASHRCTDCGTELVSKGATNFEDEVCPQCDQQRATKFNLGGISIPRALRGREQQHRMQECGSNPLQVNSSSTSDAPMSGIEHCSFCDGELPRGSGQSHMSSCPEYHRWSGKESNDSFFFQFPSLNPDMGTGSQQTSPLLIDAKFPPH